MGLISDLKQMIKQGNTAANEDAVQSTIPAGSFREVAAGYQEVIYGAFIVNGSMEVNGLLIADAIPT